MQISDDKDQVRLRILADRHTFKVGDTAEVQLHWREAPALALVTFQGARVLDYKLVQLETGANKFTIPMTAKLAPNFDLDVAVMAGKGAGGLGLGAGKEPAGLKPGEKPPVPRRFHEAISPFSVERQMQITLTPKRKDGAKGSIRPGEDVEITIKATDPQGKPISAELSVGMVEQALLNLFSPNVPPINDFFRGIPRESALRTSTSVTFAYFPTTHPIDRHLLNELERQEIAKEEAEHAKALQLAAQARQRLEQRLQAVNQTGGAAIDPLDGQSDGSDAKDSETQSSTKRYTLSFQEPWLGGQPAKNMRYADEPANKNQVDFDSLIDLITTTQDPKSWKESGSSGSIAPFETNLTLEVSQSQEVHERFAEGTIEHHGQPMYADAFGRDDAKTLGGLADFGGTLAAGGGNRLPANGRLEMSGTNRQAGAGYGMDGAMLGKAPAGSMRWHTMNGDARREASSSQNRVIRKVKAPSSSRATGRRRNGQWPTISRCQNPSSRKWRSSAWRSSKSSSPSGRSSCRKTVRWRPAIGIRRL